MPQLSRKENEALYKLFDDFTLNDQRNYYKVSVERYRKSASQINTYRAVFSLATGFASALAGLIVQSVFLGSPLTNGQPTCSLAASQCSTLSFIAILLIVIAIIAPVIGGAFNTLSDLYQWDRLVTVYSAALDNIEVADAHSPDEELDDNAYRANLMVYAEGTLQVMKDESAQWGQLIRTPAQLEAFLEEETKRAEQVSNDRSFLNPGGATVGTTDANRYGEPLPGAPSGPGNNLGGTMGNNNPQPPTPPVVPPAGNNPVQPPPPSVPPTVPPTGPTAPTNQPPIVPPTGNNPVQPQPPNVPPSAPPTGPTAPTNQPPNTPPVFNRPTQPNRPPMPRNVAQAVPHSTEANNSPADTTANTGNEPPNTPPPAEPLGEDPSAAG